MKNQKRHIPTQNQAELETMIERYFDCTLSEEEEMLLRGYLANCRYSSAIIDEALATMGLLAVGRAKYRNECRHRRVVRLWSVGSAAAAVAAVIVTLAINLGAPDNGTCVAYVNGEKVTDSEMVMTMVRGDLSKVNTASESVDDNMQQQLSSVGAAMDVEF